jgi:hypothetical protein
MAFGETYSGKLLDASCVDKTKKTESCDASGKTTAFAIDVSGKLYRLDSAGNAKASAALKNRADRAADPSQKQSEGVMASITGSESGGTIAVEAIEVQ